MRNIDEPKIYRRTFASFIPKSKCTVPCWPGCSPSVATGRFIEVSKPQGDLGAVPSGSSRAS
jgi:hypothetical protein